MGLIEPCCIEGSYNYFSMDDAAKVMHIRELRSYGLSLEQIKQLFSTTDPESLRCLMHTQQRLLLYQKQAIDLALRRMDIRYIHPVERLDDNIPYIYTSPASTLGMFYDGTAESTRKVQLLERCFPHSRPSIRFPLHPSRRDSSFVMGYLLQFTSEINEQFPFIDPNEYNVYSPLRVLMTKRTTCIANLTIDDFSPVFTYVADHNFKVTSDIIGHIDYQDNKDGVTTYRLIAGVTIE